MEQFKTALDWCMTYGLGVVLALGIAFAAWHLIIFVFKENSKREDRLAGIIERHIDNLTTAVTVLNQSHASREAALNELIVAQKQEHVEHKEMVLALQALQQEILRGR